jgi:acetyltransferase-like isoleucine patch superfamily enzyme
VITTRRFNKEKIMVHKEACVGAGTFIWHRELSNLGKFTCGTGCIIHSHVWIGDEVVIGSRVRIQAFSFIPVGVTIEDDVFIGPRVTFTNDHKPPSYGTHWRKTVVRRGASIGAGAVILPGVIIGPGAVIGAGSVVTKDVPGGETWVGNPAHLMHVRVCT